jgi:hypothetical protein
LKAKFKSQFRKIINLRGRPPPRLVIQSLPEGSDEKVFGKKRKVRVMRLGQIVNCLKSKIPAGEIRRKLRSLEKQSKVGR